MNYPPRRVESRTTLYIGNLPAVVTDATLREIFSEMPVKVKNCNVAQTNDGRSKGFGFVEFASERDFQTALETLDKIEIDGNVLILKPARLPVRM